MSNSRIIAGVVVMVGSILMSHLILADQLQDNRLTDAVKSVLAVEPDIPLDDIVISTQDNVVKLSGVVDTRLQVHKAVEVAQSVHGVKRVDDRDLKVKDSADYLRDAMTTAKVKGKIRQLYNQKLIGKNYDLHVETTNGVVHIFGKVAKNRDVNTIKDNIAKMEDVKQVNCSIW